MRLDFEDSCSTAGPAIFCRNRKAWLSVSNTVHERLPPRPSYWSAAGYAGRFRSAGWLRRLRYTSDDVPRLTAARANRSAERPVDEAVGNLSGLIGVTVVKAGTQTASQYPSLLRPATGRGYRRPHRSRRKRTYPTRTYLELFWLVRQQGKE